MSTPAQKFLNKVELFLKRSGLPASTFSEMVVNDRSFVRNLRAGRKPNLGTVERVETFIRSYDGAAQ